MTCFLGAVRDGYMVLRVSISYLWAQGCFLEDISSGSIPRPSITYHREIVSGFVLSGLDFIGWPQSGLCTGIIYPNPQSLLSPKTAFAFGA